MDYAYDHIQEQSYPDDRSTTPKPSSGDTINDDPDTPRQPQFQRQNLQTEFQETFKAFSGSALGAKLGGWWSTARTQGATYYETARKEAERREAEAAKAFEEAKKVVVERTKVVVEAAEEQLDNIVNEEKKAEQQKQQQQQQQQQQQEEQKTREGDQSIRDASTEVDEDTETFLNRFKAEAAKRLKEVQQAEDAADQALLRFGSNIRNFLKDTISIAAPEPSADSTSSDVLFESKDATTGKRVIHTSRFDAQLHVIHTTPSSFTKDPDGSGTQWEEWKDRFDIEGKTNDIASDLSKYPDLREMMEQVMGEGVAYREFWTRYYFLRYVIEMQEKTRRDLLKASTATDDDEVAWDEESDAGESDEKETEESKTSTPQLEQQPENLPKPPAATAQTPATHNRTDSDAITLRPSRRSHDEKSVADSEASYDLISGTASHANSSPKEKPLKEESDEDDWE